MEFIVWFEDKARSGFRLDFLLQEGLRSEYQSWKEDIRKKDVQLRRVVRYLKAWADNQGKKDMPSGVCLTILAAENFVSDINDDNSFYRTIHRVYTTLQGRFVCLRPTTPKDEDLFASFTIAQRDFFMSRLWALVDDGGRAMQAALNPQACALWRKHFGDRFICMEPPRIKEAVKPLAAVVGNKTRPYCR